MAMSLLGESWITRFIFSVISITAILGNLLVLRIFLKKRNTISTKKPFNVFILNLAATDLFTGVFLIVSRFLYLPKMPHRQPEAFIFCNILWGGYVLFGLGYVSVYTCLSLTIERWLAVTKPYFYRRLKTKHFVVTIIIVWIWAFVINSTVFLSVGENLQERKCEWVKPKTGNTILPFLEISVACLIPFSGIIVLYSHLFYKIHRTSLAHGGNRGVSRRRLAVIALITSIALIIGWLPTKISYILRFTTSHFCDDVARQQFCKPYPLWNLQF